MFRHPNLDNNSGTIDDLAFKQKVDQSIRYFKVPATKDKEDVLDFLMTKLPESPMIQKSTTKIRTLYYSVSSVAAVAIILIVSYLFFGINTIDGVQNASNVYYLPDNSRVVLTENSQLKYSKLFYNRNVKLKGEAYFEIEKGDNFYVDTEKGGVLVFGTRFSVNDTDNSLLVHCYEGTVGVDYLNEKIKLTAGMKLNGVGKSIDVNENNSTGYPDYAEFNFECNNKNVTEIWPLVEAYFGVEITDSGDGDKSFTGSINTGNVYEVVDIICTSMGLEYSKDGNKQIVIKLKENS